MMYKWILTIKRGDQVLEEYHYSSLEDILADLRGDLVKWVEDTSVRVIVHKVAQ